MAYGAIVLALARLSRHFDSAVGFLALMAVAAPLIPAAVPGMLLSIFLAFLGFESFAAHGSRFIILPLISTPLINSFFVYILIKRKQDPLK